MKAYMKKLTTIMLAGMLVLSGFSLPIWANPNEANEVQTDNTAPESEENVGDKAASGETAGPETDITKGTGENQEPVNPAPKKSAPKPALAPAAADEAGELSGTGTAEDPYQVATVEDLKFVAEKVNAGDAAYRKATYKLTADINLNGSKDNQWTPIGQTKDNAFLGTFIGTDYTISNLYIDDANLANAGLFGYIASPAKLVGISVDGATVTAKSEVGTIAGAAFTGTAENCTVTGKITVKGNYKVGGMFGGGYVKLSHCKVKAADGSSVTGEYLTTDFEGDNVGGLIGFRGEGATITTTDCAVSGLTVAGSRKVGGIVGSAFADNAYTGCSVSDVSLVCNAPYKYASGTAKNQLCVGGIVGIFMKGSAVGTMENCTVSDVDFSVDDPKVAEENLPIMGIVSGGYRVSSFSGASAPDGMVEIEGLKVSGTNTGANADEKFPGSVAMNGSNSVFEQGTGTAEDPYRINDMADLTKFANSVTKTGVTYEDQYIKVADGVTLDLTDGIQIGSSSKKFKGTFDGNGVVLSNLTKTFFNGTDGATVKNIVVNGQTKALLGNVNDTTIQNIKLNDVNITGASGTGALITGYVKGTTTIDGVEVTGTIAGGSYSDYVGGIIGGRATMDDADVITIKNCINKANITGAKKIGGILGFTNSSNKGKWVIENCENYGDVTSTADKDSWAGGIAGGVGDATVTSCVNEGKIQANTVAGGIVGTTNSGTKITDSKNTAEVICEGVAGGIIGNSSSGSNTVSKSANTGNITAVTNAGGIIGGTNASGDYIDNCYNGGDITATGTSTDAVKVYAGGIYGYNNTSCTVNASVNDGVIKAEKGTAYQIGKSAYWYAGATGSKNENCYYIENGTIYLASANGDKPSEEQEGMTRTQLADKLNEVGGIAGFWQSQNGSVQPDKLIPGAFDDEELRVAVITDKDGNIIEGYKSLADAVAAAKDGQIVKLEKDIELTDTVNVTGNKEITLDINGKNLTLRKGANKVLMNVGTNGGGDKSKLTLTDSGKTKGKIESAENAAAICVRKDASMMTKDVVIVFSDENHNQSNLAIQVQGELTVEKGTNINSTEGGISVIGEGSKLTFNDGTVTGEYYAITGNGTLSGSTIIVKGGVLKANDGAGIYHPQNGTLVLEGGEITGKTGVQMCAGKLDIPKNSTVKVIATGEDRRDDKDAGDGNIDDGAAISIINRGYPGGMPSVEIKGGTFVAEKTNHAVLAYTWDAAAEGDKYSDWEGAGDQVAISGGVYNTPIDEALLADGFALNEPDKDGNYGVHKHDMTKFEQKDATCTEAGLSKTYYKCEICDKYFEDEAGDVEITDVESLVIPANGHQYDDRGKCTVCGVLTPDAEAANKVDALIDAIGPADKVTLDSYDAIMAAKKAYEALTAEQQKLVTGYDDLNAAIDAYNALLAGGKDDPSGKPIDKPDKEDGKSPQTGDSANPMLILGLLLASASAAVALRRKSAA